MQPAPTTPTRNTCARTHGGPDGLPGRDVPDGRRSRGTSRPAQRMTSDRGRGHRRHEPAGPVDEGPPPGKGQGHVDEEDRAGRRGSPSTGSAVPRWSERRAPGRVGAADHDREAEEERRPVEVARRRPIDSAQEDEEVDREEEEARDQRGRELGSGSSAAAGGSSSSPRELSISTVEPIGRAWTLEAELVRGADAGRADRDGVGEIPGVESARESGEVPLVVDLPESQGESQAGDDQVESVSGARHDPVPPALRSQAIPVYGGGTGRERTKERGVRGRGVCPAL